MARKIVRKGERGMLRLASFIFSAMIGLLGFAGCCQNEPIVEYGVMPLYGPIQTKYGVIQAPYQDLDEGAKQESLIDQETNQTQVGS